MCTPSISLPNGSARWGARAALALVLTGWCVSAKAFAAGIFFDRDVYQVAPNEVFDVQVLIDDDLGLLGAQPLPLGLFSYGWKMEFVPANASVDALTIPLELDHFGLVDGASTEVVPGSAAAEGNVDQFPVVTPYAGTLLGTVQLTNLAAVPSVYQLQLSLAPHFPTEQLFLDGDGNVLDDTLQFGSATVIVAVPEPASVWLLAASVTCCLAAVNRRRLGR